MPEQFNPSTFNPDDSFRQRLVKILTAVTTKFSMTNTGNPNDTVNDLLRKILEAIENITP